MVIHPVLLLLLALAPVAAGAWLGGKGFVAACVLALLMPTLQVLVSLGVNDEGAIYARFFAIGFVILGALSIFVGAVIRARSPHHFGRVK
jgi:hypothetical protein